MVRYTDKKARKRKYKKAASRFMAGRPMPPSDRICGKCMGNDVRDTGDRVYCIECGHSWRK